MFDYLKRTCRKHFGKDREFYAVVHNLLGITPDNIDLYKLALIHRSASVMLGILGNIISASVPSK